MSRRHSTASAAAFLAALATYFVGAPTLALTLDSWWPMLIGLGGLLALVCILVAIQIVQDARDEATGVPSPRESDERADAGDLPRPHRTGEQG